MSEQIECPYCKKDNKVPIDGDCDYDYYPGYEEDKAHEGRCRHCRKWFVYHTFVLYDFESKKADCLNGEDHRLEPIDISYFPDAVRCQDCGYQNKGEYNEKEGD